MADGETLVIPHAASTQAEEIEAPTAPQLPVATGETRPVPLGTVCGARSGDKGGNANLGVWAESDEAYVWLAHELTIDKLKQLLPEARELRVERFELPNIRALNFVLHGLLGDGVSASLRSDPQAKTLGEYLRAKLVDMPVQLIAP
jgi:hypothetical protein